MDFIRERFRKYDDGWVWNEGGRYLTVGFHRQQFTDDQVLRYFRIYIGGTRSIEFMVTF